MNALSFEEAEHVSGGVVPVAVALVVRAAVTSPVVQAWALNGARAVGAAVAAGALDALWEEVVGK